ncbi:MAG: winged helix-turn-helix domain-containing protein [Candidatus Bathyarchaeota archaeon]|nr:winged helix-turn-helix domain-containing protein [Candidatus Bathyarchaeota archaeon]
MKHPARRKILRMLSEKDMTFSQMLEELGTPSSHLTYHLENLGELVVKDEAGKYKLSSFGKASVSMMKGAEEVPDIHAKRFSTLPLRWKTLYAAFLIAIIVLATMSAVQYASFNQLSDDYQALHADYERLEKQNEQLLAWSTSAAKSMTIIRDVIQLDISQYQATLESSTVEERADLGGVIEEVFKYSFRNSFSELELTLRFRNGHFSLFQLNQLEGFPIYPPRYTQTQPTDPIQACDQILERYKLASGDEYLNEMLSLLAAANRTSEDQVLGNTKLKIAASGDNAIILIHYTENQTDFSAKRIQIVSENHIITELRDDWFIYEVENAQTNISAEQAIEIAKTAAEDYEWDANGVHVSNFIVLDDPVSAEFYPQPRTEPLTLVPYWYVTLHLDMTYPGGVNVIAVGVWADTGEIANIQALSEQVTQITT